MITFINPCWIYRTKSGKTWMSQQEPTMGGNGFWTLSDNYESSNKCRDRLFFGRYGFCDLPRIEMNGFFSKEFIDNNEKRKFMLMLAPRDFPVNLGNSKKEMRKNFSNDIASSVIYVGIKIKHSFTYSGLNANVKFFPDVESINEFISDGFSWENNAFRCIHKSREQQFLKLAAESDWKIEDQVCGSRLYIVRGLFVDYDNYMDLYTSMCITQGLDID